ncbi:MAG TPA: hypothetical protein VEI07_08640 [Planctomycetaceae bacterium]|nr:hypothetical protein [Planctomycetaceae bacterium]
MTAQINDIFCYRDSTFNVSGISEGELFDISVLGLTPVATCTACWRGYRAIFTVADFHLVLDGLHVNLVGMPQGQDQMGPVINGVTPNPPDNDSMLFDNYYEGLNYHLEYSGGVLLADNFIYDLYEHMGFHPPWKYETVIELIFERGILKQEADRSDQMARIRAMILDASAASPPDPRPSMKEIRQFVERAFDRRYRL